MIFHFLYNIFLDILRYSLSYNWLVTLLLMFIYADPPYSFLIGLKRINSLNSNRGFQWIDGSSVKYSSWYHGEPNNHFNESCVIMGWFYDKDRYLSWADVPCNTGAKTFYVCQRATGNT